MKHERELAQCEIAGRAAERKCSLFSFIIQDIYIIIRVFNREHLRPEHFYLEQGIGLFHLALEEAQQCDSARTVAQTVMKSLWTALSRDRAQPHARSSPALAYNATAVSVFSVFALWVFGLAGADAFDTAALDLARQAEDWLIL